MKSAFTFVALLLFPLLSRGEECRILSAESGHSLQQCGTLKVLFLEGKPVDRARRMGELLKGPLSREVVDYFSHKILDAAPNPALREVYSLFFNQVVRLLHREAPVEISEELDAMASGAGMEAIDLKRAVSLPDLASGLNALGSLALFRALPAAGCTSVAVKDQNGNFVYGRNLDFAGAEIWDRHPLVTVVLPEAGSQERKHLVFGADGTLFGGITGVNEDGITFAVHQNYSKDASLSGVPMMFVGELVLRKARNLEEAVRVLKEYRPALLWTFVLTDLKTGEAISVETSRKNFAVRRMDSHGLVQTNHVHDPSVKDDEFISVGTKMNSIYRDKKAFGTLEMAGKDGATPAAIAAILGYQEHPGGEMIAYKDILKAHTIQSVILESGEKNIKNVYLSLDPAPTAGGRYGAFPFREMFRLPDGALEYSVADFLHTAPEKRKRQREISMAFRAYFDEKNISRAVGLLSSHQTLDASLFRAVAAYQEGFFQDASSLAENALVDPRFLSEPEYIRQSLEWARLAALQRMGTARSGEARALARKVLAARPVNGRLRALAEAIAGGKTPSDRLMRLNFEFFSGDIGGRAN